MTTSDANPAAFLKAQLDAEEMFAREAIQRPWRSVDNFIETPDGGEVARFEIKADARFAAGREPARVLRDVEAKRAILDLYEKQAAEVGENAMEEDRAWLLGRVVRLLANGYG